MPQVRCERVRRITQALLVVVGVVVGAAILATGVVRAVDDVGLSIERVEGAGWIGEGIAVELDLSEAMPAARVGISRLELLSPAYELRDVRITCPGVELSAELIACASARIEAHLPAAGAQALTGRLLYHRRNGAVDLDLDGWRIAQGTARVRGSLGPDGWRARLDIERASFDPLLALARALQVPLPEVEATGFISASIDARGVETDVGQALFEIATSDLVANNPAGSIATDMLALRVKGGAARSGADWEFDATMTSDHGQAYVQPLFVDLGAHGVELSARGKWTSARTLKLDHFELDHEGVSRARGAVALDFAHEQPVRTLELDLEALQFPGAFASYLQPLLLDTSFASLQTQGRIAGRLTVTDGAPRQADLELHAVALDDGAGRLGLSGLDGEWHWLAGDTQADMQDDDEGDSSPTAAVEASYLEWRDGTLLGLDLGPGALRFATSGRQFRLLEPTHIPVFDGAVDLERFRIRNVGLPQVAFIVDATIHPISVERLCRAFGWPEFGGSIGGVISKLRMREGLLTLGTTLRAQVFDGEVAIGNLRLEQPFGQWPRFHSDIRLENLDLELLTRAFSFGRITGRLSGAIEGLELFNWTPVAFDARLYTPPTDRSRRRISQRAVQNIGSIGGGGAGVTAALSSGFLRFFDDFNYDRLGLSCRLENDVCHMNGVAPAPNGGYYLVKGRGIPRIDVIGNARRVDWPRLGAQLVAITESEGPVVR